MDLPTIGGSEIRGVFPGFCAAARVASRSLNEACKNRKVERRIPIDDAARKNEKTHIAGWFLRDGHRSGRRGGSCALSLGFAKERPTIDNCPHCGVNFDQSIETLANPQ